jgi:hypothetical protein
LRLKRKRKKNKKKRKEKKKAHKIPKEFQSAYQGQGGGGVFGDNRACHEQGKWDSRKRRT